MLIRKNSLFTAWRAMNLWLQGFACRITISWWIFLVAGAIAALIALLTLSYQAIKASMANPVESQKKIPPDFWIEKKLLNP